MSIVSKASKAVARPAAATTTETSEFDGFWINVGVYMGDEKDAKFVRLPRGIAVSDLKIRKLYEAMDPEFAAQCEMMNEMILAIQEKCLTGNKGKPLAEGQSRGIKLSAVIYRRQEEAEVMRDASVSSNVRSALFDDEDEDEQASA